MIALKVTILHNSQYATLKIVIGILEHIHYFIERLNKILEKIKYQEKAIDARGGDIRRHSVTSPTKVRRLEDAQNGEKLRNMRDYDVLGDAYDIPQYPIQEIQQKKHLIQQMSM